MKEKKNRKIEIRGVPDYRKTLTETYVWGYEIEYRVCRDELSFLEKIFADNGWVKIKNFYNGDPLTYTICCSHSYTYTYKKEFQKLKERLKTEQDVRDFVHENWVRDYEIHKKENEQKKNEFNSKNIILK